MNTPQFLLDLEKQLDLSAVELRRAWTICKVNGMQTMVVGIADTVLDIEQLLRIVKERREQLERGIQ